MTTSTSVLTRAAIAIKGAYNSGLYLISHINTTIFLHKI